MTSRKASGEYMDGRTRRRCGVRTLLIQLRDRWPEDLAEDDGLAQIAGRDAKGWPGTPCRGQPGASGPAADVVGVGLFVRGLAGGVNLGLRRAREVIAEIRGQGVRLVGHGLGERGRGTLRLATLHGRGRGIRGWRCARRRHGGARAAGDAAGHPRRTRSASRHGALDLSLGRHRWRDRGRPSWRRRRRSRTRSRGWDTSARAGEFGRPSPAEFFETCLTACGDVLERARGWLGRRAAGGHGGDGGRGPTRERGVGVVAAAGAETLEFPAFSLDDEFSPGLVLGDSPEDPTADAEANEENPEDRPWIQGREILHQLVHGGYPRLTVRRQEPTRRLSGTRQSARTECGRGVRGSGPANPARGRPGSCPARGQRRDRSGR